jgi:DNA-binding GntR family transcriptional regulator
MAEVKQLPRPQPDESGSLGDRAYLQLREEIITAELAPGTLLREEDVMSRLGVGRTPIREAFQLLERDGFVTVIPRRGTLVTEINILDLATIYEVRVHIESWAARLAAERANEDDVREARELLAELRSTIRSDSEALLALDRRIHRFAYRCAKNEFLAQTLDHYHNLSLRILHVAMRRYPILTPRLEAVVDDQQMLLRAICDHDGDSAEAVAKRHVVNFERAIREVL